jgi:AhpD family alkylhydroperoxidase
MEVEMEQRLNPYKAAPAMMQAMMALEKYVHDSGLERSLSELVKIRASQINGCAFCLKMHTNDARAQGEAEERIYLLNAWREAPIYTARERAALAWTEAVTLITQGHAADEIYSEACAHFSDVEMVKLTVLITTINAWNRIAISFRIPPQDTGARAVA